MMIDTNVVLDLVGGYDDAHSEASSRCFAQFAARGPTYINHVVYAELTPRAQDRSELDSRLADFGITLAGLTDADAWRAGIAFRDYRKRRSPREAILPDFLIGGHAANRGWPIMTRDSRRFKSYFPEISIIDPTEAGE